jgi:phosphate transport system permease protein
METLSTINEPKRPGGPREGTTRKRARAKTSLLAHGEPMVWLMGGALALCLVMIVGLLGIIVYQGATTFWPRPLVTVTLADGTRYLGEKTREETYALTDAMAAAMPREIAARARPVLEDPSREARRRLYRTGNFDITNTHFKWIDDFAVVSAAREEWSVVVERRAWGRFYGTPARFLVDGETAAATPQAAWEKFREHEGAVSKRFDRIYRLQKFEFGKFHARLESARLELRKIEIEKGPASAEYAEAKTEFETRSREIETENERLAGEIRDLRRENDRYAMVMTTVDGAEATLPLSDIVRAYPANQLGFSGKLSLYASRWGEFLTSDPREANSEGGVWPAIVGTVIMTLLMSLAVVPFGVLAALFLREYAKAGPVVSAVRIAINNLAGVPSIVFGVFGLGFFCYIFGASIDQAFFAEKLPNPTYGKGGVLWASLTLALLTLPVVVVATEEALSAVPGSMREGSYACGASKWQTVQRIVLPRAMPGIMTGFILAMARGAGEVAPLMLVGAVKLAPDLPLDGVAPYLHPERSFMHLGFHIYDVGFQSQNSEAAKPMVFTTTLLLIAIIAALNITAIWVRTRLRRKFTGGQF